MKGATESRHRPVTLLHLSTQLLHRDEAAHTQDKVVHKLITGLRVQQSPHHLGRLARVHLLDVALNVAQHVVGVQVVCQVTHHVKPVTHIDQRPAGQQCNQFESTVT